MILGRIIGKITTTNFEFLVEGNAKKFEYIQIFHKDYDYVLCQIVEIERKEETIAKCIVIGYKDEDGRVKQIRTPFEPNTEVLIASDDFIREIIKLEDQRNGAFIGYLESKTIPIYLDLNKILTKHVSVLAKSGAGKSYTVGALIEEIMERKIPLLIIDPHGEYSEMRDPNEDDKDKMNRFGIQPKGFSEQIQEFGDSDMNSNLKPIRIGYSMNTNELIHMMPSKLSPNQMNVLYSAMKDVELNNFENLIFRLEAEENNAKFSVINIIDHLNNLGIFSNSPTPVNEMIKSNMCSIINLKGIDPELQELIVYKTMTDLFEARKKEKIPPFFAVIEEAHSFCPERSFGETKASKIIRTIASEGRKFGLGLCVISQRPARVDKSVLSQCTTQIILKITNPNDLKAISSSVEGITSESEKEIVNLPIGTSMICGLVDVPLFVDIRPRKSKHGGTAVTIFDDETEKDVLKDVKEFEDKEILPIMNAKVTKKDIELMSDKKIKKINTLLAPAVLFLCEKENDFNILFDLNSGGLVFEDEIYYLPELDELSPQELAVLKLCFDKKNIKKEDMEKYENPEDILEKLVELKYLEKGDDEFFLGKRYILSSLDKKANYQKIDFKSINYDSKLEKNYSKEEVKEKLSKFVGVADDYDCFLVRYDVEYEEE